MHCVLDTGQLARGNKTVKDREKEKEASAVGVLWPWWQEAATGGQETIPRGESMGCWDHSGPQGVPEGWGLGWSGVIGWDKKQSLEVSPWAAGITGSLEGGVPGGWGDWLRPLKDKKQSLEVSPWAPGITEGHRGPWRVGSRMGWATGIPVGWGGVGWLVETTIGQETVAEDESLGSCNSKIYNIKMKSHMRPKQQSDNLKFSKSSVS